MNNLAMFFLVEENGPLQYTDTCMHKALSVNGFLFFLFLTQIYNVMLKLISDSLAFTANDIDNNNKILVKWFLFFITYLFLFYLSFTFSFSQSLYLFLYVCFSFVCLFFLLPIFFLLEMENMHVRMIYLPTHTHIYIC